MPFYETTTILNDDGKMRITKELKEENYYNAAHIKSAFGEPHPDEAKQSDSEPFGLIIAS